MGQSSKLLGALELGYVLLFPSSLFIHYCFNTRFIMFLCSCTSSHAIAIFLQRSWYSRSLCSISMWFCIIIMCIIFLKVNPSHSPSSLALEGDFWGILKGCVNALLLSLPPLDHTPDPFLLSLDMLDVTVLAVAAPITG